MHYTRFKTYSQELRGDTDAWLQQYSAGVYLMYRPCIGSVPFTVDVFILKKMRAIYPRYKGFSSSPYHLVLGHLVRLVCAATPAQHERCRPGSTHHSIADRVVVNSYNSQRQHLANSHSLTDKHFVITTLLILIQNICISPFTPTCLLLMHKSVNVLMNILLIHLLGISCDVCPGGNNCKKFKEMLVLIGWN